MLFGLLACLAALPLLTLLFSKRQQSWAIGLLAAGILHSGFAVMAVQLLSRVSMLEPMALSCVWTAFSGASAFALWRNREPMPPLPKVDNWYLASAVLVYLAVLFFVAIVAPPNSCDSMTYHMSRIMHWVQNGSVAAFPTEEFRQNLASPGAEYGILNLQLLTGSDIMANLIQWSAMLISLVACSQIPRLLGAPPAAAWLATIFCLTLPMGILQSTSTENDYVAAGWIVSTVCCALLALQERQRKKSVEWIVLCAISVGLALLTKSTSAMILAPFALAFIVFYCRQFGSWSVTPALLSASIVALIISGFATNNWTDFSCKLFTYGTNLCQGWVANEVYSPGVVASGFLRNAALQLSSPLLVYNDALLKVVDTLHPLTGLTVDDPRTTFVNLKTSEKAPFALPSPGLQFHDGWAGYPVHALLAIIVLIAYGIRGWHSNRSLWCYGALLVLSYFVLCVLLKWQPWGNRLFLPVFVLVSPFVGGALAQLTSGPLVRVTCAFLLLVSLPFLPINMMRPLVGSKSLLANSREKMYFYSQPKMESQYKRTVALLSKLRPSQVTIVNNFNTVEYPLWVLLAQEKHMPKTEWLPERGGFSWPPIRDLASSVVVCIDRPDANLTYFKTHRLLLQEPDVAVFVPFNSYPEFATLQLIEKP